MLLYELLTGTRPFDAQALRDKSLDDIRRIVQRWDPPRPSVRLKEARRPGRNPPGPVSMATARELEGDLDWITMRALEKDRSRRYGSASDLAADLQRHLRDVPVVASPPSPSYRFIKFVRRHRAGAVSVAALSVLVIAFAVAMAVQAQRIARERDRANQEAQTAKETADFMVGLFAVADPGCREAVR